jgi:hypothetical protein
LTVPYQAQGTAYAVEAEVRVTGLAEGVCEQSFGVVAVGGAGVAWGGSVVYGCDGGRRARLTDVTDWTNGYNQDRLLGSGDFDPGDDWHSYRLEVDGTNLRLLIDGRVVLTATDDQAGGDAQPGQVGLWSQGVVIDVRRVVVEPLAESR